MNKRYDVIYEKEPRGQVVTDEGIPCTARTCCTRLNQLEEENKLLLRKNGAMEEEIECLSEENKQLRNEVKEYKEAMKRMMIDMMGG